MSGHSVEGDALVRVLTEHRADGWVCTCGWPLNDSVGSVVDHLAEQIRPLMRCSVADPSGSPCRLYSGHDGQHGDGLGTVWTTPIPPADGHTPGGAA